MRSLRRHRPSRLIGLYLSTLIGLSVLALTGHAAPRQGPDRSFVLDWSISAGPAPDLNAAAFAPEGLNGVLVGEHGNILWTDDGGRNWEQASLPSEVRSDLLAVTFMDEVRATVIGEQGLILRTENAGKSWSRIHSSITTNLTAVAFKNATDGAAVGDAGTILYTQNSGVHWDQAQVPTSSGNLKALALRPNGRGIAVGVNETVLVTSDGGKNWEAKPTPPRNHVFGRFEFELGAVQFLTESVAIATYSGTGRGHNSGFTTRPFLRSDDAGETWHLAEIPKNTGVNINALASSNIGMTIAVGDGATVWRIENTRGTAGGSAGFGAAVLVSIDEGKTWSRTDGLEDASELHGVVFADNQNVIAVGDSGVIQRADDPAAAWKPPAISPESDDRLNVVAFADRTRGMVAGMNGQVFWTSDGGERFNRAVLRPELIGETLNSAALVTAQTTVAVGERGAILRKTLQSDNWENVSPQPEISSPLKAIRFMDELRGVIAGNAGVLLYAEDGGRSWHRAQVQPPATSNLNAIEFLSESGKAIVVGNQGMILRSTDFGRSWTKINSRTQSTLNAVAFNGEETGVAVGDDGVILQTANGGGSWDQVKPPNGLRSLKSVIFLGKSTAVAVGNGDNRSSAIVLTKDAGVTWNRVQQSQILRDLLSVSFANSVQGVSVGRKSFNSKNKFGALIWTDDGGETWQQPILVGNTSLPDVDLMHVVLTPNGTGIAVGDDGTILQTRDFGRRWADVTISPRADRSDLNHVVLDPGGSSAWAFGTRGLRLGGQSPNFSPYLKVPGSAVATNVAGQVDIELHTFDEEGDSTDIAAIEYAIHHKGRMPDWKPVPGEIKKSETDGRWHLSWSPGSEHIGNGAIIRHRVVLFDGGISLAPIMLNEIVFRSLWVQISEYKALLFGALSVIGVGALYLTPVLVMLWLTPARLALAGGGALAAVGEAAESSGTWGAAIAKVLRLFTVPWFKRRPRVRRAWLNEYENCEATFDNLATDVRAHYLDQPEVLDAWVARRVTTARDLLAQLPHFRKRSTYIPIPVRVDGNASGTGSDQPTSDLFRPLFERRRTVLSIIGAGGSGKTTLACALARWSMADEEADRLMPHLAIPVMIVEETTDVVATISSSLHRMVGSEDELDDDIVRALLHHKRVVVIIDALSERGAETQRHVSELYGTDTPINALVITTRRDPQLGAVEQTQLFPNPIDVKIIVPFILEYLRRRRLTDHFGARQQLELAQRILQIVEDAGGISVTPLLVTLFVDGATKRAADTSGLGDLPVNVPDVYIDYLDRLDPVALEDVASNPHHEMRNAAIKLATVSLGGDFAPTDFARDRAEADLAAVGIVPELITRLISNGVVEENDIAGERMLRFQLDPIAEYLAAIDICRTLRGDVLAWQTHIDQLTSKDTYPEGQRGYLGALAVTYMSYKNALDLAEISFPWQNGGQRPESEINLESPTLDKL
ncbi:MAG: YCF48-related protein [Anderseniella sp.]